MRPCDYYIDTIGCILIAKDDKNSCSYRLIDPNKGPALRPYDVSTPVVGLKAGELKFMMNELLVVEPAPRAALGII